MLLLAIGGRAIAKYFTLLVVCLSYSGEGHGHPECCIAESKKKLKGAVSDIFAMGSFSPGGRM
eukprot:6089633-Karenia_brevis.AAC.1